MEFSLLEEAAIYNALRQYRFYCTSCLKNPANSEQTVFICKDLKLIASIQKKLKQDFIVQGGNPDCL